MQNSIWGFRCSVEIEGDIDDNRDEDNRGDDGNRECYGDGAFGRDELGGMDVDCGEQRGADC